MGIRKLKNDTKNLECPQIRNDMMDEKGAHDHYNKIGLKEMSKDEGDHFGILQKAGKDKGCTDLPTCPTCKGKPSR